MNWLDLVLLLPPVAMIFRGMQRGFFKQLFSLGAILLASGLAVYANRGFVLDLWSNEQNVAYFNANIISVLLLIAVVLVIVLYFGSFLTKVFDKLRLGGINSFLGAVVGFVKGSVFTLIIAFVIQAVSLHVPDWRPDLRKGSFVLPYCKSLNALALELLLGSDDIDWKDNLPEYTPHIMDVSNRIQTG